MINSHVGIMEWKIVEKEGLPKKQKYYLVQFNKDEEWFEMLEYYPSEKYFISDRTDALKPFTKVYAWCEVNCA